jgi:hypothetical protein
VGGQVSHPYKSTGEMTLLYTLIFVFLGSNLEFKIFCAEWYQAFPDFNLLLISSWIEFRVVRVVLIYLKSSTFSKGLLSIFMLCLHVQPVSLISSILFFLITGT